MNKIYTLGAALLLSFALAGCGNNGNPPPAKSLSPKAASSAPAPAEKEATLTYYQASEDGLHILKKETKVKAGDRTAQMAIKEMLRADHKAKYPILPAGLDLKSIHVEDGTATVNFTKDLNTLKSETAQTLFIAMTVDTLTEFPNIQRVEFRAEGKPVNFQIDMRKQFLRDESFILQNKG